MMLRARDPNVQAAAAGGNHRQPRKAAGNGTAASSALKRQAATLVKTERNDEGPRAKRNRKNEQQQEDDGGSSANNTTSSIIPEIASGLCIDSSKKLHTIGQQLAVIQPAEVNLPRPPRRFKSATLNARQDKSADEDTKTDNKRQPKQDGFDNDVDREQARELTAMAQYASDVFAYYRHREAFFRVSDYRTRQKEVSWNVRAQVVNWLVDLQETFELNHETLYLAVKLFDLFLDRTRIVVRRNDLQLVGSAALFVASKFDERAPPLIDDFIYLTEDGFTRDQMKAMERELLRTVNFDFGAPLSYRFLRRLARVTRMNMETLTLARYILETSLMYLEHCRCSESLVAAASLLLAMRMKRIGDWSPVLLERSAGHKLEQVECLMWELNRMIAQHKGIYGAGLATVYRKYSHDVFFNVTSIKPLEESGRAVTT